MYYKIDPDNQGKPPAAMSTTTVHLTAAQQLSQQLGRSYKRPPNTLTWFTQRDASCNGDGMRWGSQAETKLNYKFKVVLRKLFLFLFLLIVSFLCCYY